MHEITSTIFTLRAVQWMQFACDVYFLKDPIFSQFPFLELDCSRIHDSLVYSNFFSLELFAHIMGKTLVLLRNIIGKHLKWWIVSGLLIWILYLGRLKSGVGRLMGRKRFSLAHRPYFFENQDNRKWKSVGVFGKPKKAKYVYNAYICAYSYLMSVMQHTHTDFRSLKNTFDDRCR